MAHDNPFPICGEYQQIRARFGALSLSHGIESLEILSDLHHDFFALALGNMSTRRVCNAFGRLVEAHERHLLRQTAPQPIGVFIRGQIQCGIQCKQTRCPSGTVRTSTHGDLAKEGGEMGLASLPMLAPDDAITACQARPSGFVGSPIIQVPLQKTAQEFATCLLQELFDVTMGALLRLLRAEVRDHCRKLLERTRELFPFVARRVCLGHEGASFLARKVGVNLYVLWRHLLGNLSCIIMH